MQPADVWAAIDRLMTLEHPQLVNLREMSRLPWSVWKRITDDQLFDMLHILDWMEIDRTSPVPVCHKMMIDDTMYHLPAARFTNVTCLEYALINDYYDAFISGGDQMSQDKLISIMLRPAGINADTFSDKRVKLVSSAQAATWLPDIAQLPAGIKAYITMLASANIQFIYDTYGDWIFKQVEPVTEDEDPLLSQEEDSGPDFRWWGTFMSIASDLLFGNVESVHHTDIHSICQHLVMKKIQYLKDKAAIDKASNRHSV